MPPIAQTTLALTPKIVRDFDNSSKIEIMTELLTLICLSDLTQTPFVLIFSTSPSITSPFISIFAIAWTVNLVAFRAPATLHANCSIGLSESFAPTWYPVEQSLLSLIESLRPNHRSKNPYSHIPCNNIISIKAKYQESG